MIIPGIVEFGIKRMQIFIYIEQELHNLKIITKPSFFE